MKLTLSPLALAAALVLASVSPALALEIRFLQDDATQLMFEVEWGTTPQDPLALEVTSLAGSAAWSEDLPGNGVSVAVTDSSVIDDVFFLEFDGSDRSFGAATVEGFDGMQILPVSGTDYGATFVYLREPFAPTFGMADEGQPLGLMAIGTFAIGLLRGWIKRP